MKKLLLLLAVLTITPSVAQESTPQQWLFRARVLQVNQSDVSAFEKAVAKKTEMYNNKEDQPRWVTFRILSIFLCSLIMAELIPIKVISA